LAFKWALPLPRRAVSVSPRHFVPRASFVASQR
jgi:hypothetical protein